MHTRSQQFAHAAFPRVRDRKQALGAKFDEYKTFAKKFPALIHTCGIAQAVAFALAKDEAEYISDLTAVLKAAGHADITPAEPLDQHTRTKTFGAYLRLSRDAVTAASWLKRYVEAIGEG